MTQDTASRRSMRNRIGLTGRGWWFLGTGCALVVVGIVTRRIPIVQFGALVALLPPAAVLLTGNPRSGMVLDRQLSSRELPSGARLDVTVRIRGRFRRGRSLLVEDEAPAKLGGAHRFALNGISGEGLTRSHYQLRVGARGVHQLGPIRIHVVDRFGMVHRVTTSRSADEVIVHPQVVALEPFALAGASVGAGSGHLGARGAATDDVIPRDYHAGDEVRRIDWKASARTGSLMVRSEENPWRSAVTLILDLSVGNHRGREPDSSVDAALCMAASIGCLALASGWNLTVSTTDDIDLFRGSPLTGVPIERHQLLLALATVPLSNSAVPAASLGQSVVAAGSGPLVLITGRVGVPTARLLSGIGSHNPTRILIAVAAEHWATGHAESAPPSDADDTLEWFQHAGWRVSALRRTGWGAGPMAESVHRAWAGMAVPR